MVSIRARGSELVEGWWREKAGCPAKGNQQTGELNVWLPTVAATSSGVR